jgi:hypothetical protein
MCPKTRYVQYRTPWCRHSPRVAPLDVSHAHPLSPPQYYSFPVRLHDGAGNAAATAVVGAEAAALAALRLDDGAGGRGDGAGGGSRHFDVESGLRLIRRSRTYQDVKLCVGVSFALDVGVVMP